jgi:DNA-binding transcriptional regulator YhcF (GntR family)
VVKLMGLYDDDLSPIYVRIAQWLEDCIIDGSLKEDERVYSQYQLAEMFNINPATAAKGLNILADDGTIYKKRGLGMFVSPEARKTIVLKRKDGVLQQMVRQLVAEAKKLDIDEEKLLSSIRQIYESEA